MRPRLLPAAAIAACASLLSACGDAAQPTAPAAMNQTVAGREAQRVTMMDGCDPETFDGEVHTFTEAEAFGGGVVAPLNELSRNPDSRCSGEERRRLASGGESGEGFA